MEKNKKNLKILSILILVLLLVSVISSIVTLCANGIPEPKPEDLSETITYEIAKGISVVTVILGFVALLPHLYVGIKGMRIADGKAKKSKAPLVWAVIIAIFAVFSTISSIKTLSEGFDAYKLLTAIDHALDVLVFGFYFYYVRKVYND